MSFPHSPTILVMDVTLHQANQGVPAFLWQDLHHQIVLGHGVEGLIQDLCGCSLYRGQYGHVWGKDPREVLTGEPRRLNVWQEADYAG